jgi:hypothetical protein
MSTKMNRLTTIATLVTAVLSGCATSTPDWVVLATGDAGREIPAMCKELQARGVAITPGPTSTSSAHILVDAPEFQKARAAAAEIASERKMTVAVRETFCGDSFTLYEQGKAMGTMAITSFKSLGEGRSRYSGGDRAEHPPAN